jgi:hypothetical protein
MQPADASPAAAERPETAGVTVPPPRSAPDVEAAPTVPPAAVADAASDPETTPDVEGGRSPEADPDASRAGTLTDRDRRILAFEQQWWKHAGAKEQAIRDSFGLSATRYYQLLNALLDNPAALAVDPLLIGRLRRLRSSRARSRRR